MNMHVRGFSGVNAEREILARILTWPGRQDLLAGILSIVVLPITLSLVQSALGSCLGR